MNRGYLGILVVILVAGGNHGPFRDERLRTRP
jgi:hypothetical protein